MIISIPDHIQRYAKYGFWNHINRTGLEFEFHDNEMDENWMSWFSYSLPTATVDDALVLKIKFPECKIRHFAL
jgi:hypothetical protein